MIADARSRPRARARRARRASAHDVARELVARDDDDVALPEHGEEVRRRRGAAQALEARRGDDVRRHDDRVLARTLADLLAELARVLRVARRDRASPCRRRPSRSSPDRPRGRGGRGSGRSSSTALPNGSIGSPKRITTAPSHAEELAHERGDAADARRLVVLDDEAPLARLREEVVDQRLGLERDEVVDRRRARRRSRRSLPAWSVRAYASIALPDEAELEPPLDAARARARAAREEERVVAALEQHARVRLEHVLVEVVPDAAGRRGRRRGCA